MRGTRWLLLFAILAVLAVVGGTYRFQRQAQEREAPPAPKSLPRNVNAESDRWVHTYYDGERAIAEVRARRMSQVDAPSKVDLEEVEIHIYDPDGKAYDQVKSAYASLDTESGNLYSDGEVEIVLGVPVDGSPPEDPVIIRTSGVQFDVQSGRATTDRAASFVFGPGEGSSVGATYEPDWGDLRMHRDAMLHWRGSGEPMRVEAGELVYKEDASIVYLSPWSRLKRGALTLEAANSAVIIEEGAIRVVDAHEARGGSLHNGRELEYSADFLTMRFAATGEMEQIVGRGDARLRSASESAETKVSGEEIFLDFVPTDGDSILTTALAKGGAVLESKPLPTDGRPLPATRVMRSEVIKIVMRDGGQEIKAIE
ncbi:MAG: LPS export ABC transporter periplasmic protein LptC, partial [bacterium]|nr:LPS export ABC transporter periplasmic protein LptC [bacterium]